VVLVIDDDPIAGEIASATLSMAGCEVHLAQDGHAALTLLDKGYAPDVIFVDAQLPGLSGASLIAELRARGVSRVWSISASAPPAEMAAAADGFLRKPFDGHALLSVVGTENQRQEQAAASPQLPAVPRSVFVPEAPILNPEVLEKIRRKMSKDAVLRFYTALVVDLNQRIAALERAIAGGDMDGVRRMGHAIRGGCAMAGAAQVAAIGAQLEAIPISASGSSSELATASLRDLRAALQALEGKLRVEFPA
jgi:CheY-like chemotaxis protein